MHLTTRPEPPRAPDRAPKPLTLCSGAEAHREVPETVPPPPASGIRLRPGHLAEDAHEGAPTAAAEGALSEQHLQQAIVTYLPLVERVVRKLARRLPANVQRDELISAGVFGLVDSLRRNGGDQGEGFPWYARTRIRGAIVDELRAQDWLSRRARARASAAGDATSAVVATLVSLEEVIATEEAAYFASDEDDPLEIVELRSQQRALAQAVEQLPDRERQIVGRHYFDGVKLKDIGAELGVSEPRVSQLHARALGRLRALLAKRTTPAAPPARPAASTPARSSTRPVPRSARQSLPSRSARPLMGASSA